MDREARNLNNLINPQLREPQTLYGFCMTEYSIWQPELCQCCSKLNIVISQDIVFTVYRACLPKCLFSFVTKLLLIHSKMVMKEWNIFSFLAIIITSPAITSFFFFSIKCSFGSEIKMRRDGNIFLWFH